MDVAKYNPTIISLITWIDYSFSVPISKKFYFFLVGYFMSIIRWKYFAKDTVNSPFESLFELMKENSFSGRGVVLSE